MISERHIRTYLFFFLSSTLIETEMEMAPARAIEIERETHTQEMTLPYVYHRKIWKICKCTHFLYWRHGTEVIGSVWCGQA